MSDDITRALLSTGGSTVLEALRSAEASLSDDGETFRFDDWRSCTCGHVYRGAHGRVSDNYRSVIDGGADDCGLVYAEALRVIVDANRLHALYNLHDGPPYPTRTFSNAVSNGTKLAAYAGRTDVSKLDYYFTTATPSMLRAAALTLVRNAVRFEEHRNERARLDVLAQARRVVDDVAPAMHEEEFVRV